METDGCWTIPIPAAIMNVAVVLLKQSATVVTVNGIGKMINKVYIVTSQYSYEDYTVHRVFASKEAADEFVADAAPSSYEKQYWDVEEYDLE